MIFRDKRLLPFELLKERFPGQAYSITQISVKYPSHTHTNKSPEEVKKSVITEYEKSYLGPSCRLSKGLTDDDFSGLSGYRDVSKSIDLNGDRVKEFIVFPVKVCGVSVRESSGNGRIYVFQKKDNTWVKIGDFKGYSAQVINEKNDGFYYIKTHHEISANVWARYKHEYEITDIDSKEGSYVHSYWEPYPDIQ